MGNPKITVRTETPSEQIVKQASQEFSITDSRGRVISLKKPGILFEYRLVELVGESAKNQVYMNMVLPLTYVSAIDGHAVPFPSKKTELEALILRLDEDGIEAVMHGVREKFSPSVTQDETESIKK